MLDRRFGAAAAVLDGHLVVTGGFDGTRYLTSVEAYDPRARQWYALPPMRGARGEHAAAVVAGRLIVTGGVNHQGLCRDVEAYDPVRHAWVPLPPLAVGRSQCVACALDDKMWVIGGENDSNLPLGLVEEFDPAAQEWRRMPSMLSKVSLLRPPRLLRRLPHLLPLSPLLSPSGSFFPTDQSPRCRVHLPTSAPMWLGCSNVVDEGTEREEGPAKAKATNVQ